MKMRFECATQTENEILGYENDTFWHTNGIFQYENQTLVQQSENCEDAIESLVQN